MLARLYRIEVQMRRRPNITKQLLLLAVLYVGACSILNRDGPEVTCADLDNGAFNACKEGVIATCANGQIEYEGCSSDKACEATFQEAGRYRCALTDDIPVGTTSSSNATGGGTEGTPACGYNFASPACATCVEQSCCAEALACTDDDQCDDCATRAGNETPCAPDLVPLFNAFLTCMSNSCSGAC